MKNLWIVYTDGASRGNPGLAGCGAYLTAPDGKEFHLKKFIGTKTNNQAEYSALLLALEFLVKHRAQHILLKADSELMIKQLNGEYKVKNDNIIPLYKHAQELSQKFTSIQFKHVRREDNKPADKLANQAIDEKS